MSAAGQRGGAVTPARALACAVLARLEAGGQTLAECLAQPDAEALEARERAFLHELVLGTLRRRGALDAALSPCLDRPVERVDSATRRVLRLGAYQLLWSRVPARAAVSQAVALAHEVQPRAAGFVNAVLRKLAQDGAPTPPDPRRDPAGWLTSAGSLPPWLAERWLSHLGPERAVERARALLEPAPVRLRLNPRRPEAAAHLQQAGVTLTPLAVPGAFEARGGDWSAAQRQGLVYAQELGSQMIAQLAVRGGAPLLDACAAPGGKALLAADALGPTALVVAAESSPRRLQAARALAAQWGAGSLHWVLADGRQPAWRPGFRSVLVDAPCSGLGTLGRHPDLRWRARPDEPARQAQRQLELLHALARVVAPGGTLVYATCSLEPEENEQVVEAFLGGTQGFACERDWPAWATTFVDGRWLRALPERHGGDGFFAAVLRRA